MTRRRLAGAGLALVGGVALVACSDDGPRAGPLDATALCTTVQAWSDISVDVVDAFRVASRELDPPQRRVRYRASFDEQLSVRDRLVTALDRLDLPAGVRER